MAVENVNNALDRIEADKNYFDKLDDLEKAQLKLVEKKDCQQEKDRLENRPIYQTKAVDKNGEIYNKDVTLKEVMKTFRYNTKVENGRTTYESFVKIKGREQKIDSRSDLGALIQMYALSHNEVANVGITGIDGTIGEKTINGLHQAKLIGNEYKPSGNGENKDNKDNQKKNENLNEDDETNSRLSVILKEDYRSRVGKYSSSEYKLLDTKIGDTEGALKKAEIKGSTVEIKYTSAVGKKKEQTITVNAEDCKDGKKYSANKLGKAIEDAITANENKLQKAEDEQKAKEVLDAENTSIKTGINTFIENSVSDPILKKYFQNNSINITCVSFNGDNVTIQNSLNNTTKPIKRSDILEDKKDGKGTLVFNSKKYEEQLVNIYKGDALTYVKGFVNSSYNEIVITNVSSTKDVANAKAELQKCSDLLKQIDKYGATKEFNAAEEFKEHTDKIHRKETLLQMSIALQTLKDDISSHNLSQLKQDKKMYGEMMISFEKAGQKYFKNASPERTQFAYKLRDIKKELDNLSL